MKKSKNTIYVRYEFSSESGSPEGGDILQFTSEKDVQEMVAEILGVSHSDRVTVNLTIGEKTPFFGFLKKVGMSKESIEKEMVDLDKVSLPKQKKSAKKKVKAKKSPAKKK